MAGLKRADFYGNRIYAEIANPDKKYGGDERRGKRKDKAQEESNKNGKERRAGKASRREEAPRREREERNNRSRRGEARHQRDNNRRYNDMHDNTAFNYEISTGKPKARKRRK